ncbi:MAG: hypothetical protein IKK76_03130, partial [Alphaproteobacteria bacterium]|nr:hypothetical protein [Alphaproteobacteria bacterium]
ALRMLWGNPWGFKSPWSHHQFFKRSAASVEKLSVSPQPWAQADNQPQACTQLFSSAAQQALKN